MTFLSKTCSLCLLLKQLGTLQLGATASSRNLGCRMPDVCCLRSLIKWMRRARWKPWPEISFSISYYISFRKKSNAFKMAISVSGIKAFIRASISCLSFCDQSFSATVQYKTETLEWPDSVFPAVCDKLEEDFNWKYKGAAKFCSSCWTQGNV